MDDDGIDRSASAIPIKVRGHRQGRRDDDRSHRGLAPGARASTIPASPPAMPAPRSPTNASPRRPIIRSMTARSAAFTSIVPPGRVVSAKRPAPMRLVDDVSDDDRRHVFKALAPAIPDRVIAGHHADLLIAQFHGINPQDRASSSSAISARSAAAGAPSAPRTASPAPSASMTATRTTARTSRSRRNSRWWSSATRWCRIPAAPAAIAAGSASSAWCGRAATSPSTRQIDRAHCKPWGLDGGGDGNGNAVALRSRRRVEDGFPQRQGAGRPAQGGRRLPPALGRRRRLRLPARRGRSEDVRNDVRQGYVSVEDAATLYGVVVDPVTFAVDEEATTRRRAALAASPGTIAASA